MERPELVRGVRLKGLDGFFKQFFYTDIKAQLIEALADWSILLPLALIAYLSVVFIAPLMAQTPTDESLTRIFLQANRKWCVPEPQELISYLLISTVVPLGMLIWLLTRTSIIARLTSSIKESILINILWVTAAISQLALLSFILLNVVDKQAVVVRYFLVGAASVTLIGLFSWRAHYHNHVRSSARALRRRPDYLLPELIAFGYTVLRLLPSICIEPNHYEADAKSHLGSTLGAFAATINGRTNLVDFTALYTYLLNYLLEPIFTFIGLTPFTYTVVMSILALTAMMMVFAIFKALTKSSWLSLCCFLPFCAISFFPLDQFQGTFYTFANYFAAMPLRYFGPVLVAFLTSRYLQRPSTSRMFVLFFTGGLSLVNNPDFGLPALFASLVAVLSSTAGNICSRRRMGSFLNLLLARGKTASILSIFLCSVGLAVLLWIGFAFVRSGKLPDIGMFLGIRQLYAYCGYFMLPMDLWGIHWLLLLTYLSGLILVMSRRANRANCQTIPTAQAIQLPGKATRMREGMLLFASIFGLGSGMYFVGRSHPQVLILLYFGWGFAFILLCLNIFWTDGRIRIAQKPPILMAMPTSVLLATLCVLAGTLQLVPSPLFEMKRLSYPPTDYNRSMARAVQFVKSHCAPGTKVCLIHILGYSISDLAGVENVFPCESQEMVFTHQQMDTFLSALRAGNVKHVFLQNGNHGTGADNSAEFEYALESAGYHCVQVLPEPITAYPIFAPIEHWTKRPEHAERSICSTHSL